MVEQGHSEELAFRKQVPEMRQAAIQFALPQCASQGKSPAPDLKPPGLRSFEEFPKEDSASLTNQDRYNEL